MRYSDLYYASLKKINSPGKHPSYKTDKAAEIQILIEKVFKLTRSEFWIKKNETIQDNNQLHLYYRYLKRLQKQEPLAYIIKEKYFFNELFYINKNVLIPRPETELLVEKAIEFASNPQDILEIGAGCGNIAILLAKYTHSPIMTTEIDRKAFYVLQKNIHLHHMGKKVFPVLTNLFPKKDKKFDLIISNPPYVSEEEWMHLPKHIQCFEPKLALVGGLKGYEVIEKIIEGSKKYLKPKGTLMIEIGFDQKMIVERALENFGFSHIQFFKDFSHLHRIAFGQL